MGGSMMDLKPPCPPTREWLIEYYSRCVDFCVVPQNQEHFRKLIRELREQVPG